LIGFFFSFPFPSPPLFFFPPNRSARIGPGAEVASFFFFLFFFFFFFHRLHDGANPSARAQPFFFFFFFLFRLKAHPGPNGFLICSFPPLLMSFFFFFLQTFPPLFPPPLPFPRASRQFGIQHAARAFFFFFPPPLFPPSPFFPPFFFRRDTRGRDECNARESFPYGRGSSPFPFFSPFFFFF